MGTIRPALTNFALGELSPKLAGRVDLPLYTKGALEMTNVAPLPLGGCGKRGGLEWKLAIDAAAAGSCRMIPWSISNEIDILVLLFDGYIKFLNVSGGMNPALIQDDEGTGDMYISGMFSQAHIAEVRYSQSLNMLVLVHRLYKTFYVKANYTIVSGVVSIALSSDKAAFQGNVAATQYVEPIAGVYKPMYAGDIIAAFRSHVEKTLNPTETVMFENPTDDIDAKITDGTTARDVVSIVVSRTDIAAKVGVLGAGPYEYKTASSPGTIEDLIAFSPKNVGEEREHENRYNPIDLLKLFPWVVYRLDGYKATMPNNLSWADVISWMTVHCVGNRKYDVTDQSTSWSKTRLSLANIALFPGSRTISVTFNFATGLPITVDSGEVDQYTGYIQVRNKDIAINGYAVDVQDMVERLAPWMVEGKLYECDPLYKINGLTLNYASKKIVNGEPVVSISYTSDGGTTSYILLSRASEIRMTGQVGVRLCPFIKAGEYPSVVAFHQGRCCLGGGTQEPNTLYMSKVNDYFNFAYFEEIEYIQTAMRPKPWADDDTPEYETKTNTIQQTGSSSAICLVIATDENEAIQSLVAQDDLFIGTSTSEWIFPAGLTALNPRVSLVSRYGSANLQARFIRDAIMFVGSSGKTVRAFGSPGADLMQYAEHIAKAGIISFDFRQEPYNELYLVLANGTAVVGRLGDEGIAWFRIATKEGDLIESVACIRASDEDAAYFIVKRIIGASTVRTIERMISTDDSAFASRFYLDSATITPVTGGSVSINATRFVGETISIRGVRKAGGSEFSGTAVVPGNGTVTAFIDDADTSAVPVAIPLPEFTQAIFGFPYNSAIETMRLDAMETAGILKKAEAIFFRCYETGPFDLVVRHPAPAGDPTDTEDRFPITAPTYDGVTQFPYTGTIRYENMDPWSTDQTIRLESNGSTPLGIQLIIPQYQVGESL